MKKTLFINLIILFILIALIEITLRFFFSYNVQGISKNLINKELSYHFNAPNLNYGKAFGAKIYTDKNGYRIEKNQVNKESQEILFIGGSVTFGPGIKAKNTFVELLNKTSAYNIKNASVFGTNFENNIKIIESQKKNHNNIKKIFINFPLDDILSNKISLNENDTTNNINEKIKKNSLINTINKFIRSKSASYVFIKSIIVNPQLNNYIYDLGLYNNEELLSRLELNLLQLSKTFDKEKIFFFSIPYAEQVKNGCDKQDNAEKILKKIFSKMNYNIYFLKDDLCKEKNPVNFYFKNDPVHLSKSGHLAVYTVLKNFID